MMPLVFRLVAGILLAAAALGQAVLIKDVYTSMVFSNSFNLLTSDGSNFVFVASVVACFLAAGLSVASAIMDPLKRMISVLLLTCSIILIPVAFLCVHYVITKFA